MEDESSCVVSEDDPNLSTKKVKFRQGGEVDEEEMVIDKGKYEGAKKKKKKGESQAERPGFDCV